MIPASGIFLFSHFVTLKILSSRRARNTLMPKDAPGLTAAHITSKILPTITWTQQRQNGQTAYLTPQICARSTFSYSDTRATTIPQTPVWNISCGALSLLKAGTAVCGISEAIHHSCLWWEDTHAKVETVEGRVKVAPGAEAVHLQTHLNQEQAQEYKLCQICNKLWTISYISKAAWNILSAKQYNKLKHGFNLNKRSTSYNVKWIDRK